MDDMLQIAIYWKMVDGLCPKKQEPSADYVPFKSWEGLEINLSGR